MVTLNLALRARLKVETLTLRSLRSWLEDQPMHDSTYLYGYSARHPNLLAENSLWSSRESSRVTFNTSNAVAASRLSGRTAIRRGLCRLGLQANPTNGASHSDFLRGIPDHRFSDSVSYQWGSTLRITHTERVKTDLESARNSGASLFGLCGLSMGLQVRIRSARHSGPSMHHISAPPTPSCSEGTWHRFMIHQHDTNYQFG